MYDVIAYKNTSFGVSNIPESPALLSLFESITLPATDIMQQYHLNSVTVRANWEQLENVDYCLIGNAYYFVTAVKMSSVDVAVLALAFDALTSIGGVVNISQSNIADGILTRAHVSIDTFGKWTADEPFTPNEPLKLVEGKLLGDNGGVFSGTYVVSTVDLTESGTTATTYTSPATETEGEGGETVTVPSIAYAQGDQTYFMKTPAGDSLQCVSPGTTLFDGSDTTVKKQIQRARECGLDSAILGQYCIPSVYHSVNVQSGKITNITGACLEGDSGLPLNYATVKNQKALAGQNNSYYVVSMGTGNTAQFKPEDINDGNANPHFIIFADPRYQQKPYCRPKSYLGNTDQPYLQALPGQVWADAPLRYESKSGSALDQLNFYSQETTAQHNNYWANTEAVNGKAGGGLVSAVTAGLNDFGKMATHAAFNFFGQGQSNYTDYSTGDINEMANYYSAGDWIKTKQQQSDTARQAALSYGTGQTVAPSINFPRSDTMRDYFGNGFKIYRYRLSDIDLAAYDKFLTMYGYSLCKTLELTDFTNRQYFNYIECADVTLIPNGAIDKPRWMLDAAQNQLRGGVRIWHTKPDATYYTTGNPVK